ncbi:MAG: sulfotransferase [Firmicutes bacterium]|nr:sulfotransferase [Bacillota bacterium]
MKGIFWLASYPKSGNTWFRAFLSRLLSQNKEALDINCLRTDGIASSRNIFDYITGLEASDLSAAEIDELRPKVYAYMAAQAPKPLHIKIHDAYTLLPGGQPLIPAGGSRGAVYIIRNPLDIAVSLAFHLGCNLDTAIAHMGDSEYCFSGSSRHLHSKLRQKLLSWSEHVESWTKGPKFPVKIIRYEDMHASPVETFTAVAAFMELAAKPAEIEQAVAAAAFKNLQQQEKQAGFQEKPANMAAFFREGKVGSWCSALTQEQVLRLVSEHRRVMRQFGYLSEQGEPVF